MAVDADAADAELISELQPAVDAARNLPSALGASSRLEDNASATDDAEYRSEPDPPDTHVEHPKKRPWSILVGTPERSALTVGLLVCLALGGLVGLLSYRAYESHREQQQRHLFEEVARRGAINLTSIDYHHAAEDVARIMDISTGEVHQNFEQRGQPLIQLVEQVRATTRATVTEAGLESVQADEAQVLLAVHVERWVNDAPQDPSHFRMRLNVQTVGASMKISNVEFVA